MAIVILTTKENDMQNLLNWLFACLIFIASFTCYAMGNKSSAIILILAGFSLEVIFWLRNLDKPKNNKRYF